MLSGINARLSRGYQRFIKLRGSPHALAGGMALGLFIGMSPFFGLHVISALALAALLKWSKITALIGVNVTNALTAPLIYPLNYWVGTRLAGTSGQMRWPAAFDLAELLALLKQSPHIILDLVIGGIALGLPLALLGYGITLKVITVYRQRRLARSRQMRSSRSPTPKSRMSTQGRHPQYLAGLVRGSHGAAHGRNQLNDPGNQFGIGTNGFSRRPPDAVLEPHPHGCGPHADGRRQERKIRHAVVHHAPAHVLRQHGRNEEDAAVIGRQRPGGPRGRLQ